MNINRNYFVLLFYCLTLVACNEVEPYGEQLTNDYYLKVDMDNISFDDNPCPLHHAIVSIKAHPNLEWRLYEGSLEVLSALGIQSFIKWENNSSSNDFQGKGNAEITFSSYDYYPSSSQGIQEVLIIGWRYDRYNEIASKTFNLILPAAYVDISSDVIYFPKEGGEKSIKISTNTTLSVSDQYWEWGRIDGATGGKISGETEITISTKPNSTSTPRSMEIRLMTRINEVLKVIKIEQS